VSDEPASWITDEMRGLVGRPFNQARSYPVAASDIRKWAIAVYFPESPPPLYWDEDTATASGERGVVAPEDFNPFAWLTAEPGMAARRAEFDADHLESQFGVLGPGLRTNLNAGLDATYGVRIRPGDVVTAESRIVSYEEKAGRMGRMLLTVVRTVWTNQRGETVKTTEQTSIRY
jgi:hypothetical protein